MVFELGTIPLVCERADADDIAALTALCERSDAALADSISTSGFLRNSIPAWSSPPITPAVVMIIDSVQGPLLMSLQRAKETAPQMGHEGTREHWELVRAIEGP